MQDEITPKAKNPEVQAQVLRSYSLWTRQSGDNLGAVQLAERAARISHLGCWGGGNGGRKFCMGNCMRGTKKIVEPKLAPSPVALAAEPY